MDTSPQHPEPALLVEWESRWQAFADSIRPAFSPAPPPSAGECDVAKAPLSSILASLLAHVALVFAVISLLPLLPIAFPFRYEMVVRTEVRSFPLTYSLSQYLPQIRDAGGAEAGREGASGGRTGYHPTQTIRIARGKQLVRAYADTQLALPIVPNPANMLSVPGAAPPAMPRLVMPRPEAYARNVVPPPPLEVRKIARSLVRRSAGDMVVPPPVNLVEHLSKRALVLPTAEVIGPSAPVMTPENIARLPQLAADPNAVVPPPPSVSETVSLSARGLDAGGAAEVAALPSSTVGNGANPNGPADGAKNGGPGGGNALQTVLSGNPGDQIGIPPGAGPGSMALSPSGGPEPGFGGSGGGTGIGVGTGPGSGKTGTGTGAGPSGTGLGSNPNAHGGISPGPGPGGAGSGTTPGPMPGISIQGGQVFVPSFATGPAPNIPRSTMPRRAPAVTIVATSRSGGGLNTYGLLKGSKVYSIYIETRFHFAVLQYAERSATQGGFAPDLTSPEPIQTDLPEDLPRTRVIISCMMDRGGVLRNIHILEAQTAEPAAKIATALQGWRFRPVLREHQAIEVDAILGFDVGTR